VISGKHGEESDTDVEPMLIPKVSKVLSWGEGKGGNVTSKKKDSSSGQREGGGDLLTGPKRVLDFMEKRSCWIA